MKAFGEKPQTVDVRNNIKIMACKNSEYHCQGFYASYRRIKPWRVMWPHTANSSLSMWSPTGSLRKLDIKLALEEMQLD